MNIQERIMITTSARVAANMTAQGFSLKCRNYSTGRFIPVDVYDLTMEGNGIFSIDEVNQTIVERKKKYHVNDVHQTDVLQSNGLTFRYLQDKPNIVGENHVVYDVSTIFKNDDPFLNGKDLLYRCTKANLCWRNVCYEIYA